MASNPLKTLIRLADHEVDEKRRTLSALVEREENLRLQDATLDRNLLHEQSTASADPTGAGATYPAYHQRHMQKKAEIYRATIAVRKEIEKAREDLAESFRKQKSYQLAQDARVRREQEEEDRKEQEFLDEVGQTQFRQKLDASED
jgi:flagellar FliJ protein